MITVNLTGRLTRDPQLRRVAQSASGDRLDVCQMRVAARTRRGGTVYLDIAEWDAGGRAASRCLRKGSLIAFTGELRFKEAAGDNGPQQYLSAVGHVEFLVGMGAVVERNRQLLADAPQHADVDDGDIPF